MKLNHLFNFIDKDIEIENLFVDSSKRVKNAIFFCIKGMTHDSHNYIDQAIQNGAVCIVHTDNVDEYKNKYKNVVFIKVDDSRLELAKITHKFNDNPSSDLTVYAVTGTNGKTSVSYLIYKILSQFEKSAYNGTAGTIIGKETSPYTHLTTPNTLDLVKIFLKAKNNDAKSISIEVSSHALDMKRASFTDFDVAIYTNLSRDHLDYHKTMDNYKTAKSILFSDLKKDAVAIINQDDYNADFFKKACKNSKVYTYGKNLSSDYKIKNIVLTANKTEFDIEYESVDYHVESRLLSEMNVYNLTASIAAIHSQGKSLNDIINIVKSISLDIGRLQYVKSSKYSILVDYAHTPDAYEKIFEFSDNFRNSDTRVISVFGSAGKRDKGKRSIMGNIASKHSDIIILTEEDYRDEKASEIAKDIASGFIENTKYFIEDDREKAIKLALQEASEGDLIMILGKGNEDFLDREDQSVEWAGDVKIASKYAEI